MTELMSVVGQVEDRQAGGELQALHAGDAPVVRPGTC